MDTSGQPFTGVLGGLGPGEGNVIAHNGLGGPFSYPAGFLMSGSSGQITARGNLFYDNRPVAIALGLDPPHPADPGDGDIGPNGRQNAPVLTGIDYGPPTVAHFVLSSTPSTTFDVDFYASTSCVSFPVLSTQGEELVGSDPGDDRRVGRRRDRLHAALAAFARATASRRSPRIPPATRRSSRRRSC